MNVVKSLTENSLSWHGAGIACAAITVVLFASFLTGVSAHALNIVEEAVGAVGIASFAYITVICAIKSQQP
jgi:hypothetical protein